MEGEDAPASAAEAPASSSAAQTESQVLATLKTVVMQLAKDNFIDEDNLGVLLSLIEGEDPRIFAIFQKFRLVTFDQ